MTSRVVVVLCLLVAACGGRPAAGDGDAGTDTGPASTCDVTGSWSGNAMDTSHPPSVTHMLTVTLVQAGTTLTGAVSTDGAVGVPLAGTISDTSVAFHTGHIPADSTTVTYSAAAAPPCTAMSGTWAALAGANGPLSLARTP